MQITAARGDSTIKSMPLLKWKGRPLNLIKPSNLIEPTRRFLSTVNFILYFIFLNPNRYSRFSINFYGFAEGMNED